MRVTISLQRRRPHGLPLSVDLYNVAMADARNPFADPLRFERRVPECAIVIFGANGDLTKRKLLPALYRLSYDRRLPASFAVIGNSRTTLTDDQFRGHMLDAVQKFSEDTAFDDDLWKRFSQNIFYIPGDLNDQGMYQAIGRKLSEIGRHNVLFYLSTQPSYYATTAEQLGAAGLAEGAP